MKESTFVERRREYRLPFQEKVLFTDGKNPRTAYAANLSRGGVFVKTLDPYPLDTVGSLAFFIPNQLHCLCVKAKAKHIVFDRQRCDVECGMGFQFMELNESQQSLLNLHILQEQTTYMELKRLLKDPEPDPLELAKYLNSIPSLKHNDLLELRYRVNRICVLFEPGSESPELDHEREAA